MKFTISSIEDWQKVVDEIFPLLQYKILVLKGNLGAGKTTFTQFLMKKLDCQDPISSPTYAIVNEYKTAKGKVFHFDLYRMKSLEEVFDIGMDEYLDMGILSIIEWPEIYEQELEGLDYHELTIDSDGDKRLITFN